MTWTDLRYSARTLARRPALTTTLVLTIALGIGSNAAVAGFVRGLVTRRLPLTCLERMVSLFARDQQNSLGPMSLEDYLSLKKERRSFDLLGAARESSSAVVLDGRSSVMSAAAITPELGELFQVRPRGGVVVSYHVWQTELDGRTDMRQARIRIDEGTYSIAGVAPEWLDGIYAGNSIDLWTTLDIAKDPSDRRGQDLWVIGRLNAAASAFDAQGTMNGMRDGAHLVAVIPYTGLSPDVSGGIARVSALLTSAGWAVFFVACANVATFLLSRSSSRSRESSVRIALGASRVQIARQLLSDAVLISVTGAALGALLASWTARLVPSLLFQQDAEQLAFIPDIRATIVASMSCAAIMIVCGLAPLIETRHDDPARVLRRESAGPSALMRRVRAVLVVSQMACCCLLVVCAAILVTGFRHALQTHAGHRLQNAILATVEWQGRFSRPDLGLQYLRDVEQAALSMPKTVTTAWSGMPPGSRSGWQPVRTEPPNPPLRDVVMDAALFTRQSLRTVVLPPLAGRMFGGVDTNQSCPVAVLNESARDLLGHDVVGQVIHDGYGQRLEVIGVVAETEGRTGATHPTVYYYPDQELVAASQTGPIHFRVPVQRAPTRAVLESQIVSPTYFDVAGLTVVAGNTFADRRSSRCRIAVLNQEASERYFGGNAVGGAVIDSTGHRTEIVGVVHPPLLRTSQRRAGPAIYLPMSQDFVPRMTLTIGSRSADPATISAIRTRLDAVPGGRGPAFVTTLEAHLSRIALAPERIAMVLVGVSATIALLLGGLGLYGAMIDAARQRRREFGVRIALGSQGWRLVGAVLREGARLAAAGTIAGLLAARVAAGWLARISPAAGPPDTWVWFAAPLALLGAVLLASVLPARVALATDPLSVMRDE
jgi:predicted permease